MSLLTSQLIASHGRVSLQTTAINRDTDTPPTTKSQTSATQDKNADMLLLSASVTDDQVPSPIRRTADSRPQETNCESDEGQPISQFAARLPKLDVPNFAGDPLK